MSIQIHENDPGNSALGAIRVACTGDIMLDGTIEGVVLDNPPGYLFGNVSGLFSRHDVVFVNLECPLTNCLEKATKDHEELKKPGGGVYESTFLRADPKVVEALSSVGINLVGLANNHVYDCGEQGFLETLDVVRSAGIHTVGGGRNQTEAYAPALFEEHGVSVAFLAFSAWSSEAGPDSPGVARDDIERMLERVSSAKRRADHVVVAVHAGLDGVEFPRALEMRNYRRLVEAGAGVVFSHHPHVLRGWERYKTGYIFYGLGNFVSWQEGEKYRRGMILSLLLGRDGTVEVKPIPTLIDDLRPRIPKGREKEEALEYIARLTEPLGDPKHPAWEQPRDVESRSQVGMVFTYGFRSQAKIAITRIHKLRWSHFRYFWQYMKTAIKQRLGRSGSSADGG